MPIPEQNNPEAGDNGPSTVRSPAGKVGSYGPTQGLTRTVGQPAQHVCQVLWLSVVDG